MRRTVPLAIALIAGTILLAQYFVPNLYVLYETALTWGPVMAGVVAYLGIISFFRHHWIKTKRKASDWKFSIASLVAFTVMVIAGFWGSLFGTHVPDVPPTWPNVAIQDVPDDAGGAVNLEWKLVGDPGPIRKFEIQRRKAAAKNAPFVTIHQFETGPHGLGKPHANREHRSEPFPSIQRNGSFDRKLADFAAKGNVVIDRNRYRGNYALIGDGATLTSSPIRTVKGRRYRFTAIARRIEGEPKLTVTLAHGTGNPATEDVTFGNDEWIHVPPLSYFADAAGSATETFAVTGGKVAIDDVELRPRDMEYWFTYTDQSPFNYDEDFPHYGEEDSILAENPTFDVTLDGWQAGPGVKRVRRKDKEGGFCARIPAGSTLLSAPIERPKDPMGQRLRYRFRGWGMGADSPLWAEIVCYDETGKEIGSKGVSFPADSGWVQQEFLFLPPDATATFRIRYQATGKQGYAFADDVQLLPVKVDPAPGVPYVYRIRSLDGTGKVLGTESATLSGDMETIGSWKNPVGLYQWLFNYMLVPMEATMFALLAFYIASAAFRAFRARSFEATLLLVAAVLVMIGRVPLGDYIWAPLGKIADWIMTYPNGAAKRAIMIGVGLGMAATSLKLMLGIERAYLGRGE